MPLTLIVIVAIIVIFLFIDFKPAWKSTDEGKACRAVAKIANQEKLAKIAAESRSAEVRREAIRKITNQALLRKIAFTGSDLDARLEATKRLTDPDALVEIATNPYGDIKICHAAVESLSDQEKLAEVATSSARVCQIAMTKINDRQALEMIVKNHSDSDAAMEALRKLKDQHLAFEIIKDVSLKTGIKEIALDMITDRDKLLYIFNNADRLFTDSNKEEFAIKIALKINDIQFIEDNALHNKYRSVRKALVKRINDQAVLTKIVEEDTASPVRQEAVKKIEDQELLKQIYLHDSDSSVKKAAISRITDVQFFVDIIKNASKSEMIETIIHNITDQKALEAIALNVNEQRMKRCAYKNWKNRKNAILNAMDGLEKGTWQIRKSSANDLIRLLSKDPFAAKLFWNEAAALSKIQHDDRNSHSDSGEKGRSNDCTHFDHQQHSDSGIGVVFPPYPFND